ncbi:MAG TPA: response regulator [Calditerricola sp.]
MIRTLLVEDDPLVCDVNRQMVERVSGFRVVGMARDGIEGLRLARAVRPHLVLLDIYMPGQDGLTLLKTWRKEEADIDVIAVTAAQDASTVETLFRYGAVDYLVKPFRFERLKAALERYRQFRQLAAGDVVQQDDWDHLRGGKEAEPTLPKGLQAWTLHQVEELLAASATPLTADEVAAGLGLSRVTARRYLDYLNRLGRARLELEYGTVGRPAHRYRWIG